MPASRSRTEHWRRSLQQIYERGGALEVTPARHADEVVHGGEPGGAGAHLIWRVRILALSDEEIVVEQPSALGQTIRIEDGVELVGVIAVGQNRWMFRTRSLGRGVAALNATRDMAALRLAMPTTVERCQRRSFYRISTIGLELPQVDCWPVVDPTTLLAAETANQARIEMFEETGDKPEAGDREQLVMPEVGPPFPAVLVNLGGGGAGLVVQPENAAGLERCRLFWLQVDLRPHIPAPLGVTGRLAHTHRDSEQRIYAGVAFEFGHNPLHKRFVVERLCRYVNAVQREQLARRVEVAENSRL